MDCIVLHGLPGVGKLTIGRELARLTGYKLFHNTLTVELVTSVFNFGTAPFIELREMIWLAVIERAAREGVAGLIFTFVAEHTVPPDFIERLMGVVTVHGGTCRLVELTCFPDEHADRIEDESREGLAKIRSSILLRGLMEQGSIFSLADPKSDLRLDTTYLSPDECARQIIDTLHLPQPGLRPHAD